MLSSMVYLNVSAEGSLEYTISTDLATANADAFLVATIGIQNKSAGDAKISCSQFELAYDSKVLQPVVTGESPFKKNPYTTDGTTIDDEEIDWGVTYGNEAAGSITIGTTSNSAEVYTLAKDSSMSIVRISFKVLSDVESAPTTIRFNTTGQNLIFTEDVNVPFENVTATSTASVTINGTTPKLNSVSLSEDSVTVTGSGEPQTIQATATSAKGTNLTTSVKWSVSPANGGVSIDADSGVITVGNSAQAKTYTITAEPVDDQVEGTAKEATLTVVRDSEATYITLLTSGSVLYKPTITIPASKGGIEVATITAQVQDQFNALMEGEYARFEISDALTQLSQDSSSGITVSETQEGLYSTLEVKVSSAAASKITKPQTFTINASYKTKDNTTIRSIVPVELTIKRGESEVKSIEIKGADTIAVPTLAKEKEETTYTATVQDQYGSSTGNQVTWGLKAAPNGVEIDQTTGKVTVKPEAVNGAFEYNKLTFYVTATCGNVTKEKAVVLTRDAYDVTYMNIAGADVLEILTDKNNTAQYTAVDGKDQYGGGMTVLAANVTWSIEPATVEGVSIDGATGVLTITKEAKDAIQDTTGLEFTITAQYNNASAHKKITVKRAESVATSMTVAMEGTDKGPFVVPGRDASEVDIYFTATVLDQYGSEMKDQNVTWSILQGTTELENNNQIMSIFGGHVNVANAAKKYVSGTEPVTFTVKAKLGELSDTADFQLKRAGSVLDSFNLYKREGTSGEFTLVSQDMIVVPSDETSKTIQYMAKPVDQYGAEMSTDVAYTLKLTRTVGDTSTVLDALVFDTATKIGTLNVTKTSPTTQTETLKIGIHAKNGTSEEVNTFYNVTFSHKDVANVTVANTIDLTYGDERGITATVDGTGTNAKWTWTSSDTSVVTASGSTTAATLRALKSGTATITVTYEDDSRYGTATIEVTVAKKTLTVSAGSYKLSKQYTGKTAAVNGSGELQVNGLVNGDKVSDVIYIFPTQFPTANAGSGEMDVKVRVYESTGDWKDKYQLENASAEDGTVLVKVPYTITPAPLTIGTGSFKSRTYDPANNSAEVETLALNGAVNNEKLVLGTDYEVTEVRVSNNNVGTQRVSFKVTLKNSNYKWTADDEHVCEVPESAGFTVEITQAPHENVTASGSAKYGNTAVVDISSYLPAGYHIGMTSASGDLSVFSDWTLGENSLSVVLVNNPANVGKQVTFTLPISSTNYENFNLVITVTVNDKLENPMKVSDMTLYYGENKDIVVTDAVGEVTIPTQVGEGVTVMGNTVFATNVGTATVKVHAAGNDDYAAADKTITITVLPKPITLKIDDKSAYVGDTLPTLSYTILPGLVGADTLSVEPVLFVDVAEGVDPMKQVGTYTIKTSVAPDAGSNYSLTVEEGTLSVTNRPSAITPVGPSAGTVRVDETEGGTVRVTPGNASEGSTVTIVVTPDQGQEIKSVDVVDKNGNSLEITDLGGGRYSFEMPSGKVTVKAEFGKAGLPYNDVKEGDWFYSAVEYVTEAGLMGDTGHGSFEPNTNTTRAMIWAILARLSGVDTTPVSGPWYSVAQEWAMNSGVSDGTNPNGAITREQLVTMLYRYAESHGIDVTEGGMAIREFADFESVSSFAVPAMEWAVNTGLISGIDGKLVPQGLATRSQVATVLMRFAQLTK